MPPELLERHTMRNVLRPILDEAREEDIRENPSHARHPFFHPVSIATDDGRCVAAFSRDLSSRGIGLMHHVPLPLDELEISIATGRGYQVRVRTRLTWCRPCGESHFISGGLFISVPIVGAD